MKRLREFWSIPPLGRLTSQETKASRATAVFPSVGLTERTDGCFDDWSSAAGAGPAGIATGAGAAESSDRDSSRSTRQGRPAGVVGFVRERDS